MFRPPRGLSNDCQLSTGPLQLLLVNNFGSMVKTLVKHLVKHASISEQTFGRISGQFVLVYLKNIFPADAAASDDRKVRGDRGV